MSDLETLLRSTFAGHEPEVPGVDGLAAAARSRAARAGRRVRLAQAGTSVAVVVVLLAGGLAVFGESGPREKRVSTGPAPVVAVPADWQTISSLGVEISVPPTWTINQKGDVCPRHPTVYRQKLSWLTIGCGVDAQLAEVAITPYVAPLSARPMEPIVGPDAPVDVAVHTSTVRGIAAQLGEGRMKDGRTFVSLGLSSIDVSVTAVGPDPDLVRQIIGSVRPVTVDSAGCATAAPATPTWDRPRTGPKLHLTGVTAIDVCLYTGQRLGASTRLSGADASAAVRQLNAAKAGVARGPSGCDTHAPGGTAPIWLHVHRADGRVVELSVHYLSGGFCGPWYIASTTEISQVGKAVLEATVWRLGVIGTLYAGMPGYGD